MKIEEFKKELQDLGISVTEEMLMKLEKFYELLISWNEKMNLTRITNKEDVYLKHFYDSLTLIRVINLSDVETLCDVGSGAGLPGIVLKIVFPNLKITLIDSLNKRVNYLNEIIKCLELENIEAIHTRCEDYAKVNREKYDVITARAVASLKILSELCIPMAKVNGHFVAMKANINEEIAEAIPILKKLDSKIDLIDEFELPVEKSKRTLVKVKKTKETNKKYPRSIDKIKNNKNS